MKKIIIYQAGIELNVKPFDCAAMKIIDQALPIISKVKVWGDEIYFDIGIDVPVQSATADVDVGDVAYWPECQCLCIFFGRTPMSINDKPVSASEVVILGTIDNLNPAALRTVGPGSTIRIC